MPDQMPEKSSKFLEAECLKVARRQIGCSHLKAVRIGPLRPTGSGPNWEVLGFTPNLPPTAKSEAMQAIDVLRGTYALEKKSAGK
jgi:hypothetical protein